MYVDLHPAPNVQEPAGRYAKLDFWTWVVIVSLMLLAADVPPGKNLKRYLENPERGRCKTDNAGEKESETPTGSTPSALTALSGPDPSSDPSTETKTARLNILDLPSELLTMILSYLQTYPERFIIQHFCRTFSRHTPSPKEGSLFEQLDSRNTRIERVMNRRYCLECECVQRLEEFDGRFICSACYEQQRRKRKKVSLKLVFP